MTHRANIEVADPTSVLFGTTEGIETPQLYINGQRIPCPFDAEPSTGINGPAPNVPQWLATSTRLLHEGKVVALPTETVYGLAANALAPAAVARIYQTKNRPADNPLIVHVASLAMLRSLLPGGKIPAVYEPLIQRHWPGPLTLLFPASPTVPAIVTCGLPTVAVRFPAHPVARATIAYSGLPLAAPSANSSGKPSPTLALHVWDDLEDRVPLILDSGQCAWGIESTVVDGLRQPPAILRPGGVTLEQIRRVPGFEACQVYRKNFTDARLEQAPTTPGMKYRHYSPDAQVVLFERRADDTDPAAGQDSALTEALRAALARHPGDPVGILTVYPRPASWQTQVGGDTSAQIHFRAMADEGPTSDPMAAPYTRNLFRSFREFDKLRVRWILVEGSAETHEGLALMNRLQKAASTVVLYP
ncbi:hypothetical protein IWQ60_002555 [Tieghemiomyces parasiticus]|uniref:Threonylcarbamoyl-AMP synthase n=1 Tax=Tieghemiomyces parasiticus TaxID=78921 RepID=A0A9W8AHT0_9FUNG|nr:hypothetical protein IWQ60_002555 [Tieghemiomyces parasiticus]